MAITFANSSSSSPAFFKLAYSRRGDRSTLSNSGAGNNFDMSGSGNNDDNNNFYARSRHPHWRRWITGIGLSLLALLALLSWLWWWPSAQLTNYSRFSGEQKMARVCATSGHVPFTMSIELITYDADGHILSDTPYVVSGNQWSLQGETITSSVDAPGLNGAYKITVLAGNLKDSVINLVSGDDSFFKYIQSHPQFFPTETASTTSTGFWPAGRTTRVYDVFVSQSGFALEQLPTTAAKSCSIHQGAVAAP
ncbi:MAG TPA: hypothetical protein VJ761_13460 [Ktedonobacteraceae bacterium]|nr:hypothetical protein [Ktedonobacteraceae bacterium]